MSTIYVVRHGQSEANVDISAFKKHDNVDVPLTNQGITQAQGAGTAIKTDFQQQVPSRYYGLSVFSSMYHRCVASAEHITKTLDAKSPIKRNLLLSEMNCGEQEGCHAEDFEERPMERTHHDRIGPLLYKPYRGESFLDIHTRAGLFVAQQNFFAFCPATIIVGHASICLMLHYFLTHSCPDKDTLNLKAHDYWPNALVRKYTKHDVNSFEYNGVLQNGINDVLISRDAKS